MKRMWGWRVERKKWINKKKKNEGKKDKVKVRRGKNKQTCK